MLPRPHRLSRLEIQQLLRRGARSQGEHVTVLAQPLTSQPSRFAAVVSRRMGGAVERHRMKRVLRAVWTRGRAGWRPHRLVVIARAWCGSIRILEREVEEGMARLRFEC